MKFLLAIVLLLPSLANAQYFVNPEYTQQAGDIILQNTDVYYCPVAPPGPHDVREYLSNMSDIFRDPNGVGTRWRDYLPVTRDSLLRDCHPCADNAHTLGGSTMWQRFFTARNKPIAVNRKADIIVGSHVIDDTATTHGYGEVIISKNEDVDFRASGTIRMESGFHVMPGAFFHAYTEPRWGSEVLKDEFDSTHINHAFWHVREGNADDGANCSSDSNVTTVIDSDAHDAHALDIALYQDTGCYCQPIKYNWQDSACQVLPFFTGDSIKSRYIFSAAEILACPWPWNQQDTPHVAQYAHAPYGKYEVREKFPHMIHHTNNWGVGGYLEWDMNESWAPGEVHPTIGTGYKYGPFQGVFRKVGDTVFFISKSADWSHQFNEPEAILVDQTLYYVTLAPGRKKDSVIFVPTQWLASGFPKRYIDRLDSVPFFWVRSWGQKNYGITTDTMTWKVTQDGSGRWRIFSAPYRIRGIGDSARFTKQHQPIKIKLTTKLFPFAQTIFNCHWDSTINSSLSDTGNLLLDDTGLANTDLKSNSEPYQYWLATGTNYTETPAAYWDSAKFSTFAHSAYKYHTYAMEWLPNEVRFLVDSNVVRRYPDRMVPPSNEYPSSLYYDYARRLPRTPVTFFLGEFAIDNNSPFDGWPIDSLGLVDSIAYTSNGDTTFNSRTYQERHFFEEFPDCAGCDTITVHGHAVHAAHHRIDYAKIFDVPADMKLPDYPN